MEEDLFECAACAPNVQSMRAHREWLARKVNDQGEEIARLKGALAASELVRGQMTSRAMAYEAGLREIAALEVSNCDMTGVMAEAARRALKATEWPPPSAIAAPRVARAEIEEALRQGGREAKAAEHYRRTGFDDPKLVAQAAPAEEEKCPECGVLNGLHDVRGCSLTGRAPSRGEVG